MKKSGIIAFVFLALLGCREPFEGYDFQSLDTKLVIEAILTDNQELGYVLISYTAPIDGQESTDNVPEDGASVILTDDQGNDYVFYNQGSGKYANTGFAANYGTEYRMEVQVGGNHFESDWQQLPVASTSPMDIIYRPDTIQTLNQLGRPTNEYAVTLSDDIVKRGKDSFFYWQMNYFYIYDAYGQPDVLHLLPSAKRFCYLQEHPKPELMIHEDRAIEGLLDTEYSIDIASVPFGRKMIYDYSVQIIRYNVPQDRYNYFEQIERQINNDGGIFDSAPSGIEGNFTQTSGNLDVLGYFGVFNATSQRLFFKQDELPFNKLYLPTDAGSCPGHHAVDLDNTCFNCAAVATPFNSTTKPDWWR